MGYRERNTFEGELLNPLATESTLGSVSDLVAKESKQLPDNHNVTVSNPTDVSDLATEETLEKLLENSNYRHKLTDDSSSPEYYMFLSNDYDYDLDTGNWKVIKMTDTETSYCFGSDNYQTNWTNRASLIYN